MPFDKESAKHILAQIDRDELAQLGCDLTSIPSPTGQERACAVVTLKPGVDTFTHEEMHVFLAEKGVAKQYWPERLEVFDELPRTMPLEC